jgi:hypothetical protein
LNLKNQKEREHLKEIKELKAQVSTLKARDVEYDMQSKKQVQLLVKANVSVADSKAEVSKKEQELKVHLAREKQAALEISRLRAEKERELTLQQIEINELKSKLARSQLALEKKSSVCEKRDTQIEELQAQVNALNKAAEKKDKELAAQCTIVADLKDNLSSLNQSSVEKEQENKEQRQLLKMLESEVVELKNALEVLAEERIKQVEHLKISAPEHIEEKHYVYDSGAQTDLKHDTENPCTLKQCAVEKEAKENIPVAFESEDSQVTVAVFNQRLDHVYQLCADDDGYCSKHLRGTCYKGWNCIKKHFQSGTCPYPDCTEIIPSRSQGHFKFHLKIWKQQVKRYVADPCKSIQEKFADVQARECLLYTKKNAGSVQRQRVVANANPAQDRTTQFVQPIRRENMDSAREERKEIGCVHQAQVSPAAVQSRHSSVAHVVEIQGPLKGRKNYKTKRKAFHWVKKSK